MIHWDVAAMGLIYLVYGMAFFVLGVVAAMLPRQNTTWYFAPHLPLLAAFGMLHGIVVFIEMQRLSNPAEWLNWLSRLLLLTSFLPLLEFARQIWVDNSGATRLSAPWVYGTAGLGVAMLGLWTIEPLAGVAMGARWFVGAPAALLTGLALLSGRRTNIIRRNALWLHIIALAFIGYSLSSLMLSQSDPHLPAWLPMQTDFLALFGVPVQLLRALCAVTITLGFVSLVREAGANTQVDAIVFESDISIVITDANCVILRVNKAFTKSTGYTAYEAVGRKMNILKSGRHDNIFYASMWESISRTGTWQGEIWDKRKNGEIYPKWLTIIAVKDPADGVIHYVGRHIDITERKLMEYELKASEAKFRSLIDASPVPLALNDEQLNFTFLNPAFVQTFGYSMDDIPTLADWRAKAYPDSDYRYWVETTWQSTLEKAKQEKSDFPPLELAIRCKDNSIKTVLASAAAIHQDFAGMKLVILYDITQRKQREQQDKAHLDELAHVTRLGLMGEMASGIAHEVNQPMAAISTYTQVSLNLISTENPDLVKLSEILYKTQQQALRAGRIIHRMREFVKSHSQQLSSANLNTLIHNAVDLCVSELKQDDIKLTFELESNLPPVCVDQVQIEQVIINLIRNSIEALLNLPATQRRHLTIQSHLIHNNVIRVRVKDNGPGLDQDQQQQILTPFYTTKANGMGMGLSISQSLIEAHEGTLHFNSIQGKGTTFYFTLPAERNSDES
ncbi:MAG TPA: PAS domain S-box protein [Methylobacter sp.]